MVIFSEIIEKECVIYRGTHPHSKAEIRDVQHCAAILATAEFLFVDSLCVLRVRFLY